MMDGRRHSVDIPISKTLIALRRIRSLRDPSTNSITKQHSSLIDNFHWENSNSNRISLFLPDFAHACDFDDNVAFKSRNLGFERQREHDDAVDSGNESPSESCGSNHGGNELDFPCILPPVNNSNNNNLKDRESSYIANAKSSQLGRIDPFNPAIKPPRKNRVKPSEIAGGIASHLGSPCHSVGDLFPPHHGSSAHVNQDFDVLDHSDNGCGISFCWSKSPRFRESNLYYETEDRPLILHRADDTDLSGHRSMRHNGGEISPNAETPRSLSMKFRPKSFADLVGQDVVVRSLLGAISSGRITSFYLFHGPRGTGKTSASRIFAAALNCLSVKEKRPCGLCRECVSFFSGRSKDVKEVDSVRINRTDQVKSLVKNACNPRVSSRFKIFIIDECQLLNVETWVTLSNSLENLSHHVVFVMITPELDKLPQSAVSRAQRYYFPKVKDADIAGRLEKICEEEGLDFEQAALDLIAAKSCGSVRDAEMMLDQLSLLGRKIKISVIYELTGVVSDEELHDLLNLALSSDTSNTVLKARELIRSRIDPLQLVSQLANLIMDILAGKCENGGSEVRSRFSSRYTSEADLQKLRHALRILSETEKQLRVSKNQTTWFIAALLQLSSVDYPSTNADGTKLCMGGACNGGKSLEDLVTSRCESKSYRLAVQEDHEGTLESIWYKASGMCQSNQLKTFLRKKGKLSSLHVDRSTSYLAIAELEFGHRHHVSKAERSWKLIASSLQCILGCNIELRITYVPRDPKCAKLKRSSFSIFSCSRKIRRKSLSSNEQESGSDYADHASQNPMVKDKTLSSSADCGSLVPLHKSHNGTDDVVTTLRSCEGNLLSSRERFLNRSLKETLGPSCTGVDSSKEEGCSGALIVPPVLNSDNQPNCFPQTLWFQKKFRSSYSSKLSFQEN